MSDVFNYFIKKKWIGTSIIFGLIFPGLYQIITNNFGLYKEFDVFQLLFMSAYISLPTYIAFVLLGGVVNLIIVLIKELVFKKPSFTDEITNSIFKFGIFNSLIISLGNFIITKDNMWKYLIELKNDYIKIMVCILIFLIGNIVQIISDAKKLQKTTSNEENQHD